jgi:hypothetical protein
MKQNKMFGTKIKFTESFSRAAYLKKEMTDKTYDDIAMKGHETTPIPPKTLDGRYKYPSGYRKVLFYKHEPMEGIIIGQARKIEGHYTPGYGGDSMFGYEDAEPPMFVPKKVYRFWLVATSMNITRLVEKDLFDDKRSK